uniref:PUM-HD domain-containing protein n=1 Tax=Spongospora subterranea TaxID=70186 RepID=A0A0H5RQM4_9EUKA|eukprot:CRZ11009.1 hypothetical protein [Spongospora subterranea]
MQAMDDHDGESSVDHDEQESGSEPEDQEMGSSGEQDEIEELEPDSEPKMKSGAKRNADRDQQKNLLRERKARRLHGDVVQAAHTAWGSESIKSAPVEERVGRVEAVLDQVQALLSQICVKHDISRLIQSCVKYGSDEQRSLIAGHLKGQVTTLSINQYSCHVILKLLRYGSKTVQGVIVSELTGNLAKLALHRVGFRVVDLAWRSCCNTQQKQGMMFEFYGKEHSLFRDKSAEAPSMADVFKSLDETKAAAFLGSVRMFIDKCILKGTLQQSLLHSVLRQYLELADDRDALIESLKDLSLQLCATLDGVIATCIMLDYASSKQRKSIVKSWKGQIGNMCKDSDGFLAIAKSLSVLDDTVLLEKSVINEINAANDIMQCAPGCKLLLQVLAPGEPRYFTSSEQKILKTVPGTSKKSDDARRQEVLKIILPSLIANLKGNYIMSCMLLRDRILGPVFLETVKCAEQFPGTIADSCTEFVNDLIQRFSDDDLADLDKGHVIGHPVGHRIFKTLAISCPITVRPALVKFCLANIDTIMSSRAVWILVALAEADETFRKAVKPRQRKFKGAATPGVTKLKEIVSAK